MQKCSCRRGFLDRFSLLINILYRNVLVELRFRGRVVVIVCYRFYFFTPTLHQLVSELGQVPTMLQRGVHRGKLVAIDDVYEHNEVARDAQLEVIFQ